MIWLKVEDEKEIMGLKNERGEKPKVSSIPCLGCGRKWFYLSDISNGRYSAFCPQCNHVLHIYINHENI